MSLRRRTTLVLGALALVVVSSIGYMATVRRGIGQYIVDLASYSALSSWEQSKRAVAQIYAKPIVVILLLSAAGLAVLWGLPKRKVRPLKKAEGTTAKDIIELENELRKTLAQILGGGFFLATLYFTWQSLQVAQKAQSIEEETQATERESRTTERFVKALEQLGSDKLDVRLGGIYALEAMAQRREEEFFWPIIEILTSYIREHASWKDRQPQKCQGSGDLPPPPCVDVQAALTVLSRVLKPPETERAEEFPRLDLSQTDLREAILSVSPLRSLPPTPFSPDDQSQIDWLMRFGAKLWGVNFRAAHLERADLRGAQLSKAWFEDAHMARTRLEAANLSRAILQSAVLSDAHLESAVLPFAHLEGAHLERAHLTGAHLEGAHLEGAHLEGARLEEANLEGAHLAAIGDSESRSSADAVGLTWDQIRSAHTNVHTVLPSYLQPAMTTKPSLPYRRS